MTGWRRAAKPPGWYPRRGEVCLIEMDKERPALIISSDILNRHSLDVCILPISKAEHRAFNLRLKLRAAEGGLNFDSWVKCDQPTTVEKHSVFYPPLGSLSVATMRAVETAVKMSLELP